MEETRLGIPVLFHEESLHGLMATEATMFPMAIGLAGRFDRQLMEDVRLDIRQLMEDVQSVIDRDVRAGGVHMALLPVVEYVRATRQVRARNSVGQGKR